MKNGIFITTSSEEETERLGSAVAQALEPGNIVALCGNLGAGKTVVARGIARGLGIEENITSPTFVIMNRYESPTPGSAPLYHFDLYRKPSETEFAELGFSEILRGDGFCIVEWAENLPAVFAKDQTRIDIKLAPDENINAREIKITATSERIALIKDRLNLNRKNPRQ